jgi:hypothetical protein
MRIKKRREDHRGTVGIAILQLFIAYAFVGKMRTPLMLDLCILDKYYQQLLVPVAIDGRVKHKRFLNTTCSASKNLSCIGLKPKA